MVVWVCWYMFVRVGVLCCSFWIWLLGLGWVDIYCGECLLLVVIMFCYRLIVCVGLKLVLVIRCWFSMFVLDFWVCELGSRKVVCVVMLLSWLIVLVVVLLYVVLVSMLSMFRLVCVFIWWVMCFLWWWVIMCLILCLIMVVSWFWFLVMVRMFEFILILLLGRVNVLGLLLMNMVVFYCMLWY